MRFFGRLVWSIISLLTITLAMLFATSNTQIASLQLWPLAGSIDLPIWVIVLGALGAGAIIGGGLVWMSVIAARASNWRLQRRLGKAETRATRAEEQLQATKQEAAVTGQISGNTTTQASADAGTQSAGPDSTLPHSTSPILPTRQ